MYIYRTGNRKSSILFQYKPPVNAGPRAASRLGSCSLDVVCDFRDFPGLW